MELEVIKGKTKTRSMREREAECEKCVRGLTSCRSENNSIVEFNLSTRGEGEVG